MEKKQKQNKTNPLVQKSKTLKGGAKAKKTNGKES